MSILTISVKSPTDLYKLALKYGAGKCLASCIASEYAGPKTSLCVFTYETPLAALLMESFEWRDSNMGADFWNYTYSALISK